MDQRCTKTLSAHDTGVAVRMGTREYLDDVLISHTETIDDVHKPGEFHTDRREPTVLPERSLRMFPFTEKVHHTFENTS